MKLFHLIFQIAILMLMLSPTTPAFGLKISDVNHFRSYDGLSSERIFSILEDDDHVIWIGTKIGVDRFNGREFKHYLLEDDFYYGDFAARVIKLFESGDGQLFAYDNTGRIYRYSSALDKFELQLRLSDVLDGNILLNKVIPVSDGSFLLGMTTGLYRIDSGQVSDVLNGVNVNDVIVVNETVYVASTSGLIAVSGNSAEYCQVLTDNNILILHYDDRMNRLLLGISNSGLWCYYPDTARTEKLSKNDSAFEKPIRAMERLDDRFIAVGIDGNGVYVLDTTDNSMCSLINTDDSNRLHLNGNGVYSLLKDHYGNLWVGSYTGGLTVALFTSFPVSHIVHEQGNPNSICNNNVNAIAEDKKGNIWFATDGGISIQDPRSGRWKHLGIKKVIVTLLCLENGTVVCGTYGDGIYVVDSNGRILKHINNQNSGIGSNYIFSVKQDDNGDLWMATLDGGVLRFDKNLNYKKKYPVNVAFSITISPDGKVAAGTANGFYIIDPETDRVNHYASAEEQVHNNTCAYIISMLFNSNGTVWLGTEGGGINVYDPATRNILQEFKIEQGLPSNEVYSIQRDNDGRIVVGTGNGLAIFKDSVFRSLIYFYGLTKEYNKSASVLLHDGDMIFGSVFGAERVAPSLVKGAEYTARIKITGFDIEGQENNKEESFISVLKKQVGEGHVDLSYIDNSFSISFESINLPYQEDIAYQYLLEGYDKDWSRLETDGHVGYKNVAPGDYKFRVRSLRFSDGTVLDEKTLDVKVGYPWWQQWWAWCFYIIVIGLLVYFIFRYKWYKLQKRYDEDKIKFFIETAHNIKTPVSLVMAPISDLQKDNTLSPESKELISIAESNIRKLNATTTQLLEFERFDTGKQKMKLEPINIAALLTMEAECFRNSFIRKGIQMTVDVPEESVCMSGDRYFLEMMLDNLLSNACKYTTPGGEVKVMLAASKKKLQIIISDNGIGIPHKDQKKLFTNVHRAQNARESNEVGTGFGLLQVKRIVKMLGGSIRFRSKEGEGTTFVVSFSRILHEAASAEGRKLNFSSLEELHSYSPSSSVVNGNHANTILIVEDNEDLKHYLSMTFADSYNVVTASTANDALEYLGDHYPDLILSDVMMPGMQGDDFCSLIKQNPETAGIPVILLTAKSTHESVIAGLSKGADDYLAKPFSTELLKLKVGGLIENRNRLRDYLLKRAVTQAIATHELDSADEMPADEDKTMSDNDREFVEKATETVIAHITETDFSIDSLCREMAMSRTLLYGRLKSLTGKTPQEFIRLLRLERAAGMLQKGLSVTDVAEATGFINTKYFSTVFKKHFGVQPSRFATGEDEK